MIATTIEQSKHLLELGLDTSTADMYYLLGNPLALVRWIKSDVHLLAVTDIPSWSLTALLNMMPITITKDDMEYKLKIFPRGLFSTHSDTSKWTLQYCGIDYSYRARDKYPILIAVTQHDIIDAAYEMACWLLENNFIKKGGEE